MALITKGKDKGKKVEICQWCNDWFSIELDGISKIVSPTMLKLDPVEFAKVVAHKNNGILFNLFTLNNDGTFRKRRI